MAVGADPNIVMGSVNGRHLRSEDGGQNWVNAEEGLPNKADPFDVRFAAVPDSSGKTFVTVANTPGDPATSTPDLAGAFITKDGSKSWQNITGEVHRADGTVSSSFGAPANEITASPIDPKVFGVLTQSGVTYTTADGGKSWQESSLVGSPAAPFDGSGTLNSMAFDPSDATGKTFYVVNRSFKSPGNHLSSIFKTSDGGKTWSEPLGTGPLGLPDVPASVIRVDPKNSKNVYVGNELGVYRSTDAGQNWSRFGSGLPMVAVSDIQLNSDGSRLRIATYGRGFFEADSTPPAH